MRIRLFGFLVCLLGMAALSASAYRLQFKDHAGDVRTYKSTMNMQGTSTVMGMEVPMNATIDMTSTETVKAKNTNGTATLVYALKNGKVIARVTPPGEDQEQKIEQAMPLFTINYDRTPLGHVTNVKVSGLPSDQSDLMGAQAQYPGQGLEFPDRDLKIGDSWDGKQALSLVTGSTIDIKVKYTLTGTKVVNGTTYLVLRSDINTKVNKMPIAMPAADGAGSDGQKATADMTITGSVTELFDEAAGQIGNSTLNLNVDMTMSAAGGDAAGMNLAMKMKIDGEMVRQ